MQVVLIKWLIHVVTVHSCNDNEKVTLHPSSHLQPGQVSEAKESWNEIINAIIVSFSDHFTYWQIAGPNCGH